MSVVYASLRDVYLATPPRAQATGLSAQATGLRRSPHRAGRTWYSCTPVRRVRAARCARTHGDRARGFGGWGSRVAGRAPGARRRARRDRREPRGLPRTDQQPRLSPRTVPRIRNYSGATNGSHMHIRDTRETAGMQPDDRSPHTQAKPDTHCLTVMRYEHAEHDQAALDSMTSTSGSRKLIALPGSRLRTSVLKSSVRCHDAFPCPSPRNFAYPHAPSSSPLSRAMRADCVYSVHGTLPVSSCKCDLLVELNRVHPPPRIDTCTHTRTPRGTPCTRERQRAVASPCWPWNSHHRIGANLREHTAGGRDSSDGIALLQVLEVIVTARAPVPGGLLDDLAEFGLHLIHGRYPQSRAASGVR